MIDASTYRNLKAFLGLGLVVLLFVVISNQFEGIKRLSLLEIKPIEYQNLKALSLQSCTGPAYLASIIKSGPILKKDYFNLVSKLSNEGRKYAAGEKKGCA